MSEPKTFAEAKNIAAIKGWSVGVWTSFYKGEFQAVCFDVVLKPRGACSGRGWYNMYLKAVQNALKNTAEQPKEEPE